MDVMLLLVQALAVGAVGVWMSVAVRDNWQHPDLNLKAVAMVMRMDFMEKEYPEEFAVVAHKRVEDPALHRRAYRTIVTFETIAAAALLLSAALLFLAAIGIIGADTARILASGALVWFSSIWAGFIAGGNHFHYWYSHHSSQTTHYFLMFWGLLNLILIAVTAS